MLFLEMRKIYYYLFETFRHCGYPASIIYTFCVSRKDNAFQYPEIFEFDHVHPDSNAGSPTAILYGALGTVCFKEFHTALSEAAKKV